ncbi:MULTISPECIES: hypothetical protein [unclassified Streptomyces]
MSPPSDGGQAHKHLAATALASLPRVADSSFFLYLDFLLAARRMPGARV